MIIKTLKDKSIYSNDGYKKYRIKEIIEKPAEHYLYSHVIPLTCLTRTTVTAPDIEKYNSIKLENIFLVDVVLENKGDHFEFKYNTKFYGNPLYLNAMWRLYDDTNFPKSAENTAENEAKVSVAKEVLNIDILKEIFKNTGGSSDGRGNSYDRQRRRHGGATDGEPGRRGSTDDEPGRRGSTDDEPGRRGSTDGEPGLRLVLDQDSVDQLVYEEYGTPPATPPHMPSKSPRTPRNEPREADDPFWGLPRMPPITPRTPPEDKIELPSQIIRYINYHGNRENAKGESNEIGNIEFNRLIETADSIADIISDFLVGTEGPKDASGRKQIIKSYIQRNVEYILCGNSTPNEHLNVIKSINDCLKSYNKPRGDDELNEEYLGGTDYYFNFGSLITLGSISYGSYFKKADEVDDDSRLDTIKSWFSVRKAKSLCKAFKLAMDMQYITVL